MRPWLNLSCFAGVFKLLLSRASWYIGWSRETVHIIEATNFIVVFRSTGPVDCDASLGYRGIFTGNSNHAKVLQTADERRPTGNKEKLNEKRSRIRRSRDSRLNYFGSKIRNVLRIILRHICRPSLLKV